MAQVVDYLPSKCEALSSNPTTTPKKKKKKKKRNATIRYLGLVLTFSGEASQPTTYQVDAT
jgi:hypothetical protein